MINILILLTITMLTLPSPAHAQEVQDTYKGEYSIDYIVRNYNLITFEQTQNYTFDFYEKTKIKKDDVNFDIEGPVIINGNYEINEHSNEKLEFATKNPNNIVSFISGKKDSNITTPSKVSTNSNFIDISKLYKKVIAESSALAENTEYNINSKDIHINKPGIYQINSTRLYYDDDIWYYRADPQAHFYHYKIKHNYNSRITFSANIKYIYIDNYDQNSYYIFNNLKEYEQDNYVILLKRKGEDLFSYIDDFIDQDDYSGNIIFNYPNARIITVLNQSGKIIAPKADIHLVSTEEYENFNYNRSSNDYHDSIFANSITGYKYQDESHTTTLNTSLNFFPYTSNKKIDLGITKEVEEVKDYEDDIYTGTYSIDEMLKNYNLVTLGQKENGDATIFHIAGQFLVNGKLTTARLDLESNFKHESTTNYENIIDKENNNQRLYRYKRWGDGDPLAGSNSTIFFKNIYNPKLKSMEISSAKDYINFTRLYNNIVDQQTQIEKGNKATATNGVAHITVGKNYYIEDINDIDEIIFDDFDKNSDKLTVITILNNGDTYLPKLSQTYSGNYVSTKDYFGKKEPMFSYEYYNFPDDIYHGNIIWNIPNADYLELAANAPFFGHIVAPNADLTMPETHFAGAVIVNSIYSEGNSEAHFYPLQFQQIPENFECSLAIKEFENQTLNNKINNNNNNNNNNNGIQNPSTTDKLLLLKVLAIVLILIKVASLILNRNKKIYY